MPRGCSDDASRSISARLLPCRTLRGRFLRTSCRRLLRQTEMRPVIVVVADVLGHEALEVAFVEYDYMIEQIAATADESLCYSILPRALECRTDRPHAENSCCFLNLSVEGCVPIENQIAWCGIVWECLPLLLRHPSARRMLGDVEVKDLPSVVRDHEKAVEHAEG